MVRPSHPALDYVGRGKRLEYLAHGGERTLRPYDTHGVILAHVFARYGEEPLSGGRGSDLARFPVVDRLHSVAPRRTQKDKHVVYLFRRAEDDLLGLQYIVDLEGEAGVQAGGNHQPDSVEGVGKHLV